jgi:predicted outer membrane protein
MGRGGVFTRVLWRTGALGLVAATLLVVASPASAPSAAHEGPGGVDVPNVPAGRSEGALSAADQDLVIKVRLAGLWEIPAGQMAARKGVSPRVRAVGTMIASQHGSLDELARRAAAQLGIPLPDVPNADQELWLREMREATGPQFDQVFIDRLRAAHGKIFPAIGQVRSSTRNNVVRKLAQEANQFVLTHLTLLESSGLVDYSSLPPAPEPESPIPPGLAGAQVRASFGGADMSIIWFVIGIALVAGSVTAVRIIRPR